MAVQIKPADMHMEGSSITVVLIQISSFMSDELNEICCMT